MPCPRSGQKTVCNGDSLQYGVKCTAHVSILYFVLRRDLQRVKYFETCRVKEPGSPEEPMAFRGTKAPVLRASDRLFLDMNEEDS